MDGVGHDGDGTGAADGALVALRHAVRLVAAFLPPAVPGEERCEATMRALGDPGTRPEFLVTALSELAAHFLVRACAAGGGDPLADLALITASLGAGRDRSG